MLLGHQLRPALDRGDLAGAAPSRVPSGLDYLSPCGILGRVLEWELGGLGSNPHSAVKLTWARHSPGLTYRARLL